MVDLMGAEWVTVRHRGDGYNPSMKRLAWLTDLHSTMKPKRPGRRPARGLYVHRGRQRRPADKQRASPAEVA
jgi:hypothetical protein